MKKIAIVVLSLVSQSSWGLDLLETYQLAQQNDPAWHATLNNYLADQQNERLALAAMLPTLNANGTMTRSRFDSDLAGQTFFSTSSQYGVSLRQPLFSAERWARYQQAKVTTNLNDANLRAEQQAFALRVAEAYFAALQADAQLAALQSEERAFKQQYDMMQNRLKAGIVARTDVTEALAQYQNAVASRIAAEVAITNSQEALSAIIGQPVENLAKLREDLEPQTVFPDQIDAWEQLALKHHPNITVAHWRHAVAEKNRGVQRAAMLPQLDLVSNWGQNNQDLSLQSFSDGRTLSASVQLTLPIYNGGQTVTSIRQATYQRDAARDQLHAAQRQASAQARSAFLSLKADQARIVARQAALDSGKVVAESSKAGYELGVRNIVDVFLAQRSAFAAERDYIAARYDYVLNVIRLRAAAGQLTASDLAEINGWLISR